MENLELSKILDPFLTYVFFFFFVVVFAPTPYLVYFWGGGTICVYMCVCISVYKIRDFYEIHSFNYIARLLRVAFFCSFTWHPLYFVLFFFFVCVCISFFLLTYFEAGLLVAKVRIYICIYIYFGAFKVSSVETKRENASYFREFFY